MKGNLNLFELQNFEEMVDIPANESEQNTFSLQEEKEGKEEITEFSEEDTGIVFDGWCKGFVDGHIDESDSCFVMQSEVSKMQNGGKTVIAEYEKANKVIYKMPKTQKQIKSAEALSMVINEIATLLKSSFREAVKSDPKKMNKVRTYKNKAKFDKIVHDKPVDAQGGKGKKILIFVLICIIVGAFAGVKANSYYLFMEGKVNSILSCAFSWLMYEGTPIALSPLYADVFFVAFGCWAGIMAIIGLLIWLEADQKKQSRVGHEHGRARLGTPADFKSFKVKFMD